MKKNLLLFIVCLVLCLSCSEDSNESSKEIESISARESSTENIIKVGEMNNGEISFISEEKTLVNMFNANLKHSASSERINSVKIVKDYFLSIDDKIEYYLLVGANSDNSLKMATQLSLDKNIFTLKYFKENDQMYAKDSVTCTGSCNRGCDPKLERDVDNEIVWICSDCKPKAGNTCSKSVTTSIGSNG